MSSTVGRIVVAVLTNKRGSGVSYGDLVYIDTGNADAFTVGTTSAYTGMVGVCIEKNGIANNTTGRIQTQGVCAQINLNASGTLGHYVKSHTVAAQATDAGASRVVGAFGQILTGGTSTPDVLLFGFPDAASSSAAAGTPAVTLSTTNGAGVATTFVATDATIAVFDSTAPVTQAFGDSAATGSAGTAAHRDHKHGMPANPVASGTQIEVDYVEYTSTVSLTATSEATATTIVTANALSGDGSTKYVIEFQCAYLQATAGVSAFVVLYDGSSSIGKMGQIGNGAIVAPVRLQRRLTPSNASHTYSIRGYEGSGAGNAAGGAGGSGNFMPGFIRIIKIAP